MKTPTGADDWQHIVEEDYDRWLALIPNSGGVMAVFEKEPGAWRLGVGDGDSDTWAPEAPRLPVGPFSSVDEAMRAGDAWCRKWAPRMVGLPGFYNVRICTDGNLRIDSFDGAEDDVTLTAEQARVLAGLLLKLADEVDAARTGIASAS